MIGTLVLLPSLLSLSLADCGIQDSYGRRIGDLCRHEKIAEMNLSGNAFEEMACIFLANGLGSYDDRCLHVRSNHSCIRSSREYQFDPLELELESHS